jgi:septal ring factor EnvC (AmiA/AmiB activator)
MEGGDYYTPAEAERLLARTDKPISERRIRQMLQAGELEGHRDEQGRWHVAQHEVHRLIEERREIADAPPEAPTSLVDAREWIERATALERELGRLEGRLELEETTRSTLEEQLRRERERADRLEAELAERRRGWFRRFFGIGDGG